MRARYAEAAEWRLLTEGAFTPERPDGVLDLSGIVKGHAIREAGMSLLALGMADWCLNAGGDVLVSGSPSPGSGNAPWRAGIVDPADRRTLLAGFPLGGAGLGAPPRADGAAAERRPTGAGLRWQPRAPLSAGTTSGRARPGPLNSGRSLWPRRTWSRPTCWRRRSWPAGFPMLNRATASWDIEVLAVRTNGELLATRRASARGLEPGELGVPGLEAVAGGLAGDPPDHPRAQRIPGPSAHWPGWLPPG